MDKVFQDAFASLFAFIGRSMQFVIGLAGTVLVTALSLSGEILDDLSTYKNAPIDWFHVAKVVGPPVAVAAAAYIQHTRLVAQAYQAGSTGQFKAPESPK